MRHRVNLIACALAVLATSASASTAATSQREPRSQASHFAAPTGPGEAVSFANWVAREDAHGNSVLDAMTSHCTRRFASEDAKLGTCLVAALLAVRPKLFAHWQRGIARTTHLQAPACKRAINAYWMIARSTFAILSLYYKSHRHERASQLTSDLLAEPYAVLEADKDVAKARAKLVCG